MTLSLTEFEYVRRLSQLAEAQNDSTETSRGLLDLLAGYVENGDGGDVSASAGLISYVWNLRARSPDLIPGDKVLEALNRFCAEGATRELDPPWLIQFFLMRATAAAHMAPEIALIANEEAIAYFKRTGLPFSKAISEVYIALGDIHYTAGRYKEAEMYVREGLEFERKTRT